MFHARAVRRRFENCLWFRLSDIRTVVIFRESQLTLNPVSQSRTVEHYSNVAQSQDTMIRASMHSPFQ